MDHVDDVRLANEIDDDGQTSLQSDSKRDIYVPESFKSGEGAGEERTEQVRGEGGRFASQISSTIQLSDRLNRGR